MKIIYDGHFPIPIHHKDGYVIIGNHQHLLDILLSADDVQLEQIEYYNIVDPFDAVACLDVIIELLSDAHSSARTAIAVRKLAITLPGELSETEFHHLIMARATTMEYMIKAMKQ